jgi:hypothetical protein
MATSYTMIFFSLFKMSILVAIKCCSVVIYFSLDIVEIIRLILATWFTRLTSFGNKEVINEGQYIYALITSFHL